MHRIALIAVAGTLGSCIVYGERPADSSPAPASPAPPATADPAPGAEPPVASASPAPVATASPAPTTATTASSPPRLKAPPQH
jgi:hypothetical protein